MSDRDYYTDPPYDPDPDDAADVYRKDWRSLLDDADDHEVVDIDDNAEED